MFAKIIVLNNEREMGEALKSVPHHLLNNNVAFFFSIWVGII